MTSSGLYPSMYRFVDPHDAGIASGFSTYTSNPAPVLFAAGSNNVNTHHAAAFNGHVSYPYRERTSQACNFCRARHSKCNGEKPTCKRCRDHNRECVWTPSPRAQAQLAANAEFENMLGLLSVDPPAVRRSHSRRSPVPQYFPHYSYGRPSVLLPAHARGRSMSRDTSAESMSSSYAPRSRASVSPRYAPYSLPPAMQPTMRSRSREDAAMHFPPVMQAQAEIQPFIPALENLVYPLALALIDHIILTVVIPGIWESYHRPPLQNQYPDEVSFTSQFPMEPLQFFPGIPSSSLLFPEQGNGESAHNAIVVEEDEVEPSPSSPLFSECEEEDEDEDEEEEFDFLQAAFDRCPSPEPLASVQVTPASPLFSENGEEPIQTSTVVEEEANVSTSTDNQDVLHDFLLEALNAQQSPLPEPAESSQIQSSSSLEYEAEAVDQSTTSVEGNETQPLFSENGGEPTVFVMEDWIAAPSTWNDVPSEPPNLDALMASLFPTVPVVQDDFNNCSFL